CETTRQGLQLVKGTGVTDVIRGSLSELWAKFDERRFAGATRYSKRGWEAKVQRWTQLFERRMRLPSSPLRFASLESSPDSGSSSQCRSQLENERTRDSRSAPARKSRSSCRAPSLSVWRSRSFAQLRRFARRIGVPQGPNRD